MLDDILVSQELARKIEDTQHFLHLTQAFLTSDFHAVIPAAKKVCFIVYVDVVHSRVQACQMLLAWYDRVRNLLTPKSISFLTQRN